MIKIHLIGNVTADAKTIVLNNNQLIEFSICCNEKYKNSEGEKCEKKYYFNIKYWNNSTTLAQYIVKGQQVYVEGEQITSSGYENSQGVISSSIDIKISNLQLLGSSKNSGSTNSAVQNNTEYANYEPVSKIDDLPY